MKNATPKTRAPGAGLEAPPTPPAPRARKRRKDARPAELVEAGLQEFLARGFAGARLEDVARRAGVSKGTIYRYFADKEALFTAAIRSRIAPAFEDLAGAVEAYQGQTRDLLRMLIETMHKRVLTSDMPFLMRVVVAEGALFPGLVDLYYRETVSKAAALLGRIVARGRARGEVRAGPAADLPIALIGPAVLGALWRLTFARQAPLDGEKLLAAHLDLVFCALLVAPPPAGGSSGG